MDAPGTTTTKTCPQCGASFTCDPAGCWCSDLPPVMPMIDNASCYCPTCLKAIIAAKVFAIE